MRRFFVLSLFVITPQALAQSAKEVECFSNVMKFSIEADVVVVAKSVENFCKCAADKIQQGFSTFASCPKLDGSSRQEYDQFF